jgi:hypothetical protein
VHTVRRSDNPTIVQNVLKKQENTEFHDDEGTDDYLELQRLLKMNCKKI